MFSNFIYLNLFLFFCFFLSLNCANDGKEHCEKKISNFLLSLKRMELNTAKGNYKPAVRFKFGCTNLFLMKYANNEGNYNELVKEFNEILIDGSFFADEFCQQNIDGSLPTASIWDIEFAKGYGIFLEVKFPKEWSEFRLLIYYKDGIPTIFLGPDLLAFNYTARRNDSHVELSYTFTTAKMSLTSNSTFENEEWKIIDTMEFAFYYRFEELLPGEQGKIRYQENWLAKNVSFSVLYGRNAHEFDDRNVTIQIDGDVDWSRNETIHLPPFLAKYKFERANNGEFCDPNVEKCEFPMNMTASIRGRAPISYCGKIKVKFDLVHDELELSESNYSYCLIQTMMNVMCHVPFHLEIVFIHNGPFSWIIYKYTINDSGQKVEWGPQDGGYSPYRWPQNDDFHLNISIVPCLRQQPVNFGANILVTFQQRDTLVTFPLIPMKNWQNNYLLITYDDFKWCDVLLYNVEQPFLLINVPKIE